MSLPLWSKRDAEMYRGLSLFPKELEGKFLNVDEFRSHFRDLYGRPIQDIVEALSHYGQQAYFKYEIRLTAKYLKRGQALAQATAALSKLQPEPKSPTDAFDGLSEPVHAKVLAEQPLTVAEVRSLPDEARFYLAFMLSDIARERLREELAIYNDNTFIQPSRLVKSKKAGTATNTVSVPAPDAQPVANLSQSTPTLTSKAAKLSPLSLHDIRLTPESYDKHKGVLHLAPFHDRIIAGKGGVKRSNGKKYDQCWIMECIFKSDKSLKHGVEISSILGIHKSIVDKTTTKKIENAKTAINDKVAAGGGPKNLIKMQKGIVFLNNSYL
ncbi:MAG: hypothetical protein JWN38_184 [Candidatus Saccharibacteria bacterium]|nr:hypothetical protein [Candidatus Saccharibacteria bacterium]